MAYKRLVIHRPLPAKFFSHIRPRGRNAAGRDVATFDLTLLDEKGRVLGEIEGFSMRSVGDLRAAPGLGHAQPAAPAARDRDDSAEDYRPRGIPPSDGAKAFVRIVNSDGPTGVFVLPDGPITASSPAHPAVNTTPVRTNAADPVESVLAGWWQELLGHERVGLDDDFFDLGGHSLIVVRLFAKIKKTYGVRFGLSTLFEARTVRTLARLIREANTTSGPAPTSGRSFVAIQRKGTRPPLYVISGLGGNVLKFHGMAYYLGEDQPVYGLLPRGLDGDEPYHTRVEDMAAHYVEAIRKVQAEGPIAWSATRSAARSLTRWPSSSSPRGAR